jgi:hypothetical protein
MELEIFEALTAANVPADKARTAATSIKKEINEPYALHATQMATRGDVETVRKELAEAKAEIIKWCIATMFGSVALFATIVKLWQ